MPLSLGCRLSIRHTRAAVAIARLFSLATSTGCRCRQPLLRIPCSADVVINYSNLSYYLFAPYCHLFLILVGPITRWHSIVEIQAIPRAHRSCTSHWNSKGSAKAACPEHPFSPIFYDGDLFLQRFLYKND